MLARDLGDCRDNYKKLAERVSHSYSCLKNQTSVSEKVDYPRKDNSNYPYSFFSNLLPLLISAIGKLNKINILFENRRVFGVFTMWENKKPWDMSKIPISQGLIFSVGR